MTVECETRDEAVEKAKRFRAEQSPSAKRMMVVKVFRIVRSRYTVRHTRSLLQQIAVGINQQRKHKIEDIQVELFDTDRPDCKFLFGLNDVLDYLANDIYFDDRGDWAAARLAKVETI
jgi:hypothetical protein